MEYIGREAHHPNEDRIDSPCFQRENTLIPISYPYPYRYPLFRPEFSASRPRCPGLCDDIPDPQEVSFYDSSCEWL